MAANPAGQAVSAGCCRCGGGKDLAE